MCSLYMWVDTAGQYWSWDYLQGCETNFLSLGPHVISLTSIRLTTGPISQSYLHGSGHHKHLVPLVANHPQMGHSCVRPPNVASWRVGSPHSHNNLMNYSVAVNFDIISIISGGGAEKVFCAEKRHLVLIVIYNML